RWVSVQTVVRWPPLDRYRSPGRRGQVPCGGVVLRCPSLGLLGAEFEDGVVGCLRVGVGDGGEAAAGEDVESEVAAPFGPFVGLLGQDGTDEPDDGLAGGEDPTASVRRRISLFNRSAGLFDQICTHTSFGNVVKASRSARAWPRW